MKKRILTCMVALSMVVTSAISAGAARVGEKISEAVHSNLAVYINNYPISSYVVNDYAVIVAEDLANYCCDVVWNGEAKTLNITKSNEKTQFTTPAVYQASVPTGTHYADVLYTDIKTYVNGKEVTSFNINGRTMIVIDEFGANMDGYLWDAEHHAARATLDGKPQAEFAPIPVRTEKVYSYSYEKEQTPDYFSGEYDMDFDGKKESIEVRVAYEGEYQYANVSIGEKKKKSEMCDGGLTDVYVTDINSADGVKDLVVVTEEVSGDPIVRIYRYTDGLRQYSFDTEWEVAESFGTGYVSSYLNVPEDNCLIIKTQTDSYGMWGVLKTYRMSEDGIFYEEKPEHYEILAEEFMDRDYLPIEDAHELRMWEKGYVKAHSRYESNGMVIRQGEYFKVLYDNGYNFLYIVKENGQDGWISIEGYPMSEVNPYFFFLAG